MSIKKIMVFTLLFVSLFTGCHFITGIKGSGNIVSQQLDFADFTQVEASHQFKLEITRADQYKVIVHLDDNLQKYLKTTKKNHRLVFDMKGHHNFRVSDKSMRVEISMPTLSAIDLSGAAKAQIQGFDSKKPFKVQLSGASCLKGDIQAAHCNFRLSGASNIRLSGSAASLDLQASGASGAVLIDFMIQGRTQVALSGASKADINCQDELSYEGSGASDLTYRGTAKLVKADTSGAASIQHR